MKRQGQQNKSELRFEAHQEWISFEKAISLGKTVTRTFTPEAIMLVFLALGVKAIHNDIEMASDGA